MTLYLACSIPWDPRYLDPTHPLPINDVLLARNVTGVDPEQIHLTYWSASTVVVSWATGEGVTSTEVVPLAEQLQNGVDSVVLFGTSSGNLTGIAIGCAHLPKSPCIAADALAAIDHGPPTCKDSSKHCQGL